MIHRSVLLALCTSALMLTSACSKNVAPEALPAEQVSTAVESAFKDASGEAKDSATAIVESLQAQDNVRAFLELQALSSRPDLTTSQRDAAARSMLSMNERLRDAAAQGDQKAADALQAYRALK
jgi:hypothetical protein